MNITNRFLKYVSFETTSKEESTSFPSTECQLALGKYLAEEMKSLGLKNVRHDKFGYVYGVLPANTSKAPAIGLISHMDTSESASGKNVKPRFVEYKGGDIKLSGSVTTSEKDFPILKKYKGQTLIVTDGTTLLGADDKAGIAEIMSSVEYLIAHPEIKHGKICVGITPDEETGRGAAHFDIKGFGAEFAYTIDGGTLGEIEYESFNAAGAKLIFNGVNVHPGYAKNIMKNAVLMANDFIQSLPEAETPAHTEGYEGYYHVQSIKGDECCTKISMLIRDHNMQKFKARKKFIEDAVAFMNKKYGKGSVELDMHDSYYNMKTKLASCMHIVKRAEKAMKDAGVEHHCTAIRGGTDGCTLSYNGLPCPNLSTGGENFHGINEFVSVDAMNKMVEVIVNIVKAE